MHAKPGSTLGKSDDSCKRCGEKNSAKKMRIVDGVGVTNWHDGACELMILQTELGDSMFGSQSTVTPRFPTAVNFFASFPEAATIFTTTHRPLFPDIPRRPDSTEILAFLSSHHARPSDMTKTIDRELATML